MISRVSTETQDRESNDLNFQKNRKEESTWGVLTAENRFYYFIIKNNHGLMKTSKT